MIGEIAKDRLDPVLKPHGFKRKNLAWNRQRGEFVDVITLQKAKYSTPTEQSITGNVAVCVPEFRKIMFGETPSVLIEADGVFTIRFAALAANDLSGLSLDRWWDLKNKTQDTVASELSDIVTQNALPFLDLFSDFSAIERHLSQMTGWQTKTPYFQLNHALVYWKLGNRAKCEEILSSINKWGEKVELVRKWVAQHSR